MPEPDPPPSEPDAARHQESVRAGASGPGGQSAADTASTWEPWVAMLADSVRGLDDGGSLEVTGPDDAARPAVLRRPRLRGFFPGRYRDTRPWVRLRRDEQHLRGWCVGSETTGGGFPLAPEDHAALLALGWRMPSSVEGADYLRWWPDDVPTGPYLPADDTVRAARAVAETFRTVLAPGRPPPAVDRMT
ncbi:MAG: TY-Chap domain-containing protein [Dermatophilaceae bacterium]